MRQFLLISLLVLGSITQAHTGVCSDLLMGPHTEKLLQLTRKLNPSLLTIERPTMERLYLALKSEDQRYRGKAIPLELENYLRETFAGKFELANNSAATQFYVNSLYSYELRVADLWRVQEARARTGSMLSGELESFATHLLDTFFSPNALNDKALRADDAAEIFANKPWLAFPWMKAIVAVAKFKKENPEGSSYEFSKWYQGDLKWNELNRISIALARDRRPGVCCLSEPGCVRCPLNRGFRTPKN